MNILSLWCKYRQRTRQCVLCHDSASDGLCAACSEDLADLFTDVSNSCPLCFRKNAGGAICGQCQKHPPHYRQLWASLYYEPPVSSMIHAFKHSGDLGMTQPLAALMMRHAPSWLDTVKIDAVLAMPLSKERRLERGFNQSEELASVLAAHYGWQVLPRNTISRKHRQPQSTLTGKERMKNIKNVFAFDARENHFVKNSSILLIDDVVTTGATLNELAKVLKSSGFGEIYCWSLARVQMKK